MNRPQPLHPLHSPKSLEMTMRDALDGLQEVACQSGLQPFSDCLQILSIEAASEVLQDPPPASVSVLHLAPHSGPARSSNVLDFLLQREAGR